MLKPEPTGALAMLLAETVDRLVRQVVGEVEIDGMTLLARAREAAELIGKDTEPSQLRCHPDDAALLEAAALDIELVADPALERGALVLETGHGWIEDGPAVRLDRLRAALDRMGREMSHRSGSGPRRCSAPCSVAGGPRRIGRLAAYDGLMMEATGFSRPIGAGARIIAADGHVARAEVVGFKGSRSLLMALDGDAAHAAGARVEPDASSSLADVGPALLGRVIDALGQPLDGLGPIATAETLAARRPARQPARSRPGHRNVRHRRARDQRSCSPPASASGSRSSPAPASANRC